MSASAFSKFAKSVPKFLEEYNKELVVKVKEVLNLTDEQVSLMVEKIKVEDLKTNGRKSGVAKTRAPTAYNLFVQQKIKEIRAENPTMDRKELMVQAAAAWTIEKAAKAAKAVEETEVKENDVKETKSKKSKK
jgi:hypothetical protein